MRTLPLVETVAAVATTDSTGGDRQVSTVFIGLLTLALTLVALWFASRH